MNENFLDYSGLVQYTNKFKAYIESHSSSSGSGSGGVGQSMAGQSVQPTSDTTVKAGEGAEIFNDYRERTFNNTTATDPSSGNIASGKYSHAEGFITTASGNRSHAEGYKASSTGVDSHSEGYKTTASGEQSHAEGKTSTASGHQSHAEGLNATASGSGSHAEGTNAIASGVGSHAEGGSCKATAAYSHAEGFGSIAEGASSHAEGCRTTASNYASHASGKNNKEIDSTGTEYDQAGDVFVIGNGTGSSETKRSNALRLAYEGTLYLTKAYNSTGADYAEFFEWLDGNPENEDRVGRFVTLHGDKLKIAKPGDYILGVVSGQPCIIGNSDEDWLGRWEHDDFNRFVKEYLVENEVEVALPEDLTEDELHKYLLDNELTERDGHYFKMETEVVDYVTDSWRHKANPNYDASQPYVERKDRKEWDAVGMVGVLSVIDDGTCTVNSYATVTTDGTATKADTLEFAKSWRVIDRVNEHVIKIVKM